MTYLAFAFAYDMVWGRAAERPEWVAQARTYPLLHASGDAIADLVEARRGPASEGSAARADPQNQQ